MEYPKKSVNGDSGEYFVAYTVTRLFGWPCRLFDVDIGVDAELEIMDDAGVSTGDVIKIQVKSFDELSNAKSKSIYVHDRHINYWKRFCLPVIVCCVDLNAQKVYWKQILSTEAYVSGGSFRKISLDLAQDELIGSSKQQLRLLAIPESSKQIEPLFQRLEALYKELKETGTRICVDGEELDQIEKDCDAIYVVIAQIENLIAHFPWRVGAFDLSKLTAIKRSIQITRNDTDHSFSVGLNGM